MGDRTYTQLFIWDVPTDQARPLLDVITADELGTNAGYTPHPDPTQLGTFADLTDQLVIGQPGYHHEQATVGWMYDTALADELIEAAPGATWTAWEDPAYGHLGTLRVHVPDLGQFQADCDSNGNPMFHGQEVLAASGDREELRRTVGAAWFERIEALRARLGPREHRLPVPPTAHPAYL